MFGHQDDNHDDNEHSEAQENIAPGAAHDQQGGGAQDSGQDNNGQSDQAQSAAAGGDNSDDSWQHPGEPIDDNSDKPEPISDIVAPDGHQNPSPGSPMPPAPQHFSDNDDDNEDAQVSHELIDIKQKALTQLVPLSSQLDQAPEEKFRTIMMMIQASDDQSLVKQAYEAANAIEDEKVKAQALLDIVNEINYFTQHSASGFESGSEN